MNRTGRIDWNAFTNFQNTGRKDEKNMRFIHATYNMLHNSIDVTTFDGYVLRIDCRKSGRRTENNAML